MSKRTVFLMIVVACFMLIGYIFLSEKFNVKTVAKQDAEALQLTEENRTRHGIQRVIEKNHRALQDWWAPNKQLVAFTYLEDGSNPVMYVWKVGEEKPVRVHDVTGLQTHPASSYYWSPDSNYVIAGATDSGVKKKAFIYSVEKKQITNTIPYVYDIVWSPDSSSIAFGQENSDVAPMITKELKGTVDLAVYSLDTGETTIVKKGTADYFLRPIEWDGDGNLHAEKRFIHSARTSTNLIIKID